MDRKSFADRDLRDRSMMTKRLKRKKRKRLAAFMAFCILIFAIIAVSGYFLFTGIQKKGFDVKHVEVIGNKTVDSKTVIDAAGIPENTNIFLLNMNQISQNLKNKIECSYLMVSKKFPDTIMINLVERPVICAISEEDRIYYLNEQFEIIEISSYLGRTEIPLVVGLSGCSNGQVGQVAELKPAQKAEEIRKILTILNNSQYLALLSEIDTDNDGSLRIITKNNLVIHFDDLNRFKEKYDYIGSILKKNKSNQEVDLSSSEKIIVKNR